MTPASLNLPGDLILLAIPVLVLAVPIIGLHLAVRQARKALSQGQAQSDYIIQRNAAIRKAQGER